MPSWKSTIATCHAWPRAALDTNETKLVASGAKRCLCSPNVPGAQWVHIYIYIYTVQYTHIFLKKIYCIKIRWCISCYIIHTVFLYVLVHSWPTLCKPSWSEECLDRCKSYFVWCHTYHIKNAYLYVVNLKYNAIERASNQTVLEPFSTSTVIVTLSQLPLHCTAGYFTITNVRAEWAFALSSKCEGLDASPSHKLPKQHWRPLGQETNLQGCEGMGWLGGFLGGRQSSLRVKLMFGHSQILKAFKLYIKINWRIKRLKRLHGQMLQAFLKTFKKNMSVHSSGR